MCLTGYDTAISCNNPTSVYIRGGNSIGSTTIGGNVIISAGIGTTCNGNVEIMNLRAKTTETNMLYIDSSGIISSGTTEVGMSTANNGLTKTATNVVLGGALTGNTTISGGHTVNFCTNAKVNTQCGYQISGVTMFRTAMPIISSIYIGCQAGSNGTGSDNFGVGNQVLFNNVTGDNNIAIGNCVLNRNSVGSHNIGEGYMSLFNNTDGAYNISEGYQSLYANTVGSSNIAFGQSAMFSNSSGCYNVAIGCSGLYCNVLGSNNVAIGQKAGYCATGCTSVYIGQCAGYSDRCSNKLYIANTAACTLIYGEFDKRVVIVDGDLCATVNMYAPNFHIISDARCKTNIVPLVVKPINVDYKQYEMILEPNQVRYGVIAQELQVENPELVRTDKNGMLSVTYFDLLIKEIAYLKYKVCELEKRIS